MACRLGDILAPLVLLEDKGNNTQPEPDEEEEEDENDFAKARRSITSLTRESISGSVRE